MEMMNEKGEEQAIKAMDEFKEKLGKQIEHIAGDALDSIYDNLSSYIASDALENYRSGIVNSFSGWGPDLYGTEKEKISKALLRSHREEITNQVIEDQAKEIDKLKKEVFDADEKYREAIRSRY